MVRLLEGPQEDDATAKLTSEVPRPGDFPVKGEIANALVGPSHTELKAELVKFKKGFVKSIQQVKLSLLKDALQYTRVILGKAGEYVSTKDEFTIPFDDIIGITKKIASSSNQTSIQSLQIHTMAELTQGCTGCKRTIKRLDYQFQCIRKKETADTSSAEFISFCKALAHSVSDNRPKELAIIINPIGGKHNAKQQWLHKAKPLFNLAKIRFQEYETQRTRHALDIAANLDIQHLDGIVCVGGDGLFNEIINGLMSRKDKDRAIQLPIGLIPAGSQNALAVSCAGTVDTIKHALWIIKGYKRPLDIMAVKFKENPSQRAASELSIDVDAEPSQNEKYSAVVVGFGLLGEVGKMSDNYRWMGPTRYIYCGGKRLLSPLFYKCKISYLPYEHEKGWSEFNEDAVPQENNWTHLEEEVFNLFALNVSGANTQTPAVIPTCDPADGAISVCIWKKCNRVNIVNYLLSQYSGNHINLDFIRIFKARALRFEPITECPINIDGEIFSCAPFELHNLPSAATLMCPKIGALSPYDTICF